MAESIGAGAVDRFVARVVDYRATVRRTRADGVAEALAAACRGRGARSMAVPADTPRPWLDGLERAGVSIRIDPAPGATGSEPLTYGELDAVDGALTACALAIAETGTVVLDGGAVQGRRVLSLLPDYHLCVVRADQVVASVAEGVSALRGAAIDGRPLTLISGPSATSDIELTRVEGVHGPRTLEVVLIADSDLR